MVQIKASGVSNYKNWIIQRTEEERHLRFLRLNSENVIINTKKEQFCKNWEILDLKM